MPQSAVLMALAVALISADLPTEYRVRHLTIPGEPYSFFYATLLDDNGYAAGRASGPVGQDVIDIWLFDGVETKVVSPRGGIYEYQEAPFGMLHRTSALCSLLPGGMVALNASLWNGMTGTDAILAGTSGWTRIGLDVPGSQWAVNGLQRRVSQFYDLNNRVIFEGVTNIGGPGTNSSSGYTWYLRNGGATPAYPAIPEYSLNRSADSIFQERAVSIDGTAAAYSPLVLKPSTPSSEGYTRSEVWYSNGDAPMRVPGLAGPLYQGGFNAGPFDIASSCDADGRVLGVTKFIQHPLNVSSVTDGWFFDGVTTYPASLTGPGYEYVEFGQLFRSSVGIALAGPVAYGISGRLAASAASFQAAYRGVDVWRTTGGPLTVINLTGPGYEFDNAGTVQRTGFFKACRSTFAFGGSNRYATNGNPCGKDVWRHDGVSTRLVSLRFGNWQWTNAGTAARDATPIRLTDQGWITGSQRRYTSSGADRGQDVWWFNGTSSRVINPTGAPFEWNNAGVLQRYASVPDLSTFSPQPLTKSDLPDDYTIGTANRYSATGADRGVDIWLFDGNATKIVSPHTADFGWDNSGEMFFKAEVVASTKSGYAAGTSERYTPAGAPRGKGLWVYSPVTGETASWVPPTVDTYGNTTCSVLALTGEGTLLGQFTEYGPAGATSKHVIVWNQQGGFQRLDDLVPGSVQQQGWTSFDTVFAVKGANAKYILGSGTRVGDAHSGSQAFLFVRTPPCPADVNTDGIVNTADLTFFLGRFGQPPVNGSLAQRADFNADGAVNTADLVFFLARFGTTCP